MTWPTWAELAVLMTASGTLGRGIVWLVQRQSRKTITAVQTERDLLRRIVRRKVRRQRRRSQRRRRP